MAKQTQADRLSKLEETLALLLDNLTAPDSKPNLRAVEPVEEEEEKPARKRGNIPAGKSRVSKGVEYGEYQGHPTVTVKTSAGNLSTGKRKVRMFAEALKMHPELIDWANS